MPQTSARWRARDDFSGVLLLFEKNAIFGFIFIGFNVSRLIHFKNVPHPTYQTIEFRIIVLSHFGAFVNIHTINIRIGQSHISPTYHKCPIDVVWVAELQE